MSPFEETAEPSVPEAAEPLIAAGDRVRHAYVALTGTVKSVSGEYARINWDHYGLAVAALGSMADLQKLSMLEKDPS